MSSPSQGGDQRGLLAHPNSSSQGPSTSDLSNGQRTLSNDDTYSEPDDQHLLSPGKRSPAKRGITHDERESSAQAHKEKLDDLLALVEKSQRQIQQLLQSQQAVRDAMDRMTPLELQQVAQSRRHDGLKSNIGRDGSQRTTDSKWSEMHDASVRPDEPLQLPPHAKFQPPIDDDYYQQNPWYGQPPKRPVFGLGGPLPHTVREYVKDSERKAAQKLDPEMGQVGPQDSEKHSHKPTLSLGKKLPHRLSSKQKHQRDAAKKHGPRKKPKGEATVENPQETNAHQEYNEKQTVEDQAFANQAGTDGSTPQNGYGQPQQNVNPFASFDRIGENYDAEEEGNGVDAETNGQDDDAEATDWAIDAEPLGNYEREEEAETGEKDPNELRNCWARLRAKHPEPLAEFLCTLVSIFLGMCATLQVNLAQGSYGDYETSCWAWGIAFMFGIYLSGGVSGAHMNPAISFSLWLFRGFPRKQMFVYWICQLLACICAAALAFGIFHDTIRYVDPDLVDTATSFYSKPQTFVSPTTAFFTQFIAAAVMMMSVLSLGDDQNNPPGAGLHAFVMGLLVTAQKMTLGYNTGVALNPASDFGPRLVCLMVGYNTPMFTERGFWWLWGPWGAAVAGSVMGCCMYDALVFVGSESPINYKMTGDITERLKKVKRLAK